MNNMTITEANQNFSKLVREVDESGSVAITKNGKVKYIVMTERSYEKMNTIYGKVGDTICCVEKLDGVARIWKLKPDSFVRYEAETVDVSANQIKMNPEEFFRVKYWDDMEDPTSESEKAMELLKSAPEDLPEYELSVVTKNKVWE